MNDDNDYQDNYAGLNEEINSFDHWISVHCSFVIALNEKLKKYPHLWGKLQWRFAVSVSKFEQYGLTQIFEEFKDKLKLEGK